MTRAPAPTCATIGLRSPKRGGRGAGRKVAAQLRRQRGGQALLAACAESRLDRVHIAANLRHHDLDPVFNEETVALPDGGPDAETLHRLRALGYL